MIDGSALAEGDELPSLVVTPDLETGRRYCAVMGVAIPFFYDVEAARAQGMPGPIVPGPLKLGLITRAVEEWLGGAGFVRQVRAAHRRPDPAGRPITITGRVARIYDEDGRRRADLEMAVVNESGEPSVRGLAVVEFRNEGAGG